MLLHRVDVTAIVVVHVCYCRFGHGRGRRRRIRVRRTLSGTEGCSGGSGGKGEIILTLSCKCGVDGVVDGAGFQIISTTRTSGVLLFNVVIVIEEIWMSCRRDGIGGCSGRGEWWWGRRMGYQATGIEMMRECRRCVLW